MDKTTFSTTQPASVDILEVIDKLRKDLIKDFLDERTLAAYVSEHFKIGQLSRVQVEFIKKDLKTMFATTADPAWYQPIIDDFRTNGSAALSEGNEKLFYKEIEGLLKKHIYD